VMLVWWPLLLASLIAFSGDSPMAYFVDQVSQLNLIQNTSTLKSLREHCHY
jgi:hypothetical protein